MVGLIAYQAFRPRACKFIHRPYLRIDTVKFGEFIETIPQTGTAKIDPAFAPNLVVNVPIDQIYLNKIVPGLTATSTINNSDYTLQIVSVDTVLSGGRFSAILEFNDTMPALAFGQLIRLRIELSKPRCALLIDVGGFYKDTRGNWIFVVDPNGAVVKRQITLGSKNPNNFEILGGLKEGEAVITSSYEKFVDRDGLDIETIRDMYED